jgi:hypothetical protein
MPVPLHADMYRSPSLFKPEHFLSYMKRNGLIAENEKAPQSVIFSYQHSLFDFVIKHHPVRFPKGYFDHQLDHRCRAREAVPGGGRRPAGAWKLTPCKSSKRHGR